MRDARTRIGLAAVAAIALGTLAALLVVRDRRAVSPVSGPAFPAAKAPARRPTGAPSTTSPIDEWLFVGDAFEGTFIQLNTRHRKWPAAQWRTEFANLRRVGLRTLIIQWTQHDDTDFSTAGEGRRSTLQEMVAAADDSGINLYVGLSLRQSWWETGGVTRALMAEELARNKAIADRIHRLLKPHRSFRGWYIPHEVTDVHYTSKQRKLILDFFKQLCGHLNRLDALKPVMAAGYTDRDKSKLVPFVAWWTRFFDGAGVDIVVFQDGAGIPRQTQWQNILPFVEALVSLDKEFPAEVWLLAEVFAQTSGRPIDDRAFKASPADIARVRQQLTALGTFKKRLVIYSYFDYMRPAAGDEAARLYRAYRQLLDEKVARAAGRPVSSTAPAAPPGTR